MSKEQFEVNLRLQQTFANLVAPGGLGQVGKKSYFTFRDEIKLNSSIGRELIWLCAYLQIVTTRTIATD